MYGWFGKVVRVDLTRETATIEDVDPQIARDFIGGRGWAIKYLYDEVDPAVDPLAPENKLIFGTGPLTATPAPRMLEEPLTEGPAAGHVVELGRMLPEFYRHRGWDEKGVPTPEKLTALRLSTD